MEEARKLSGYPSIDQPWRKYYSGEALSAPLPRCTMFEYVWENNRDHLSDIALRYYGTKITYGKLFAEIRKAVDALYAMGVRAGDIVTIMSMHTPEAVCAMYALNWIGAVANMVYPTLSGQELIHILEETGSKLFFVLDAVLEKVEAVRSEIAARIIVLSVSDSMPALLKIGYHLKAGRRKQKDLTWREFLAKTEGSSPQAADSAAPAVMVYTSGTTGVSKGVVLNSDCVNSVVFQCIQAGKNYQRKETFLDNIPVFFGFGVSMLHLGLVTGIENTLWIEITPEQIAKAIVRIKPMRYAGGPPIVDPLMRAARGDMSYLIEFTGGGEALAPEKESQINDFLRQHGSKAVYTTGYGMSECCSVVCMQQNHIYRAGSMGIPLPRCNVRVIDPDTGEDLPYDRTGELWFSAPNIMQGYWKNKKETDQVITVDDDGVRWLHTGDLGSVDADGFIYYSGRIKRIYPTAGIDGTTINKIFPQRIEECIESDDSVERCGVIVVPDAVRVNAPVAFVLLKTGAAGNEQRLNEIRERIRKELPDHLWPKAVHILESMPMTQTGKIDYRALEKLAEERSGD